MFASGAWEPATSARFVSRAHLQPKAGTPGAYRVCVDLSYLNSFLRHLPTRNETLKRLANMVEEGDFMFSFDLKDGFHAVAIAPEDRHYLTFDLEGVGLVQLVVLPFGLSSSPYVFNKLMRVFTTALRAPLAHLRRARAAEEESGELFQHTVGRQAASSFTHPRTAPWPHVQRQRLYVPPHRRRSSSSPPIVQSRSIDALLPRFSTIMARGLRVLPFVDDFLVLSRGRPVAEEEKAYTSAVLELLGLTRNAKKGVWEPTQALEHLGLGVDTARGVFFVTPARLHTLANRARAVLCVAARNNGLVPRKELASFAGLAQSLYLAVPAARHWLRTLHDCIATGGTDWSRRVRMSSQARHDLQFFVTLSPKHSSRAIRRSPHTAVLHCDASPSGWGGVLNFLTPARAFWRPHQARHHITLLEAKAVRFTVEAFLSKLQGRTVLLHEDNQAVVAMLKSWVSRSPELLAELRKTWQLLDDYDILLDSRWISTHNNVMADRLSRFRLQQGWRLHGDLLRLLLTRWGECSIDRFASAEDAVLPAFNSMCLDPKSAGTDAFAQENWEDHLNFCNPPFAELPRLAHLLRDSGAAAVVVAPYWPAQGWFQALQELAVESFILPQHLVCLSQPPSPRSERSGPTSWQAIVFAIPEVRA